MSDNVYPDTPWKADPQDRDGDNVDGMYRVVRAADGRPLFFVDRQLSASQSENICRLVVAAPKLLTLCRQVFYGTGNADGTTGLSKAQWDNWRQQMGPMIADCWPVEWDTGNGKDG
jgi:hypothetical protein